MKQKNYTGIIPEQYTGKEIEAEAFSILKSDNEAKQFYRTAKERLLNVNEWHHIAGIISAKFQIVTAEGKEIERKLEKGDYIKIDIPGPGSSEGDGYDWVCAEDIREVNQGEVQSMGFRVRPSKNPLGNKNETAHFYADKATSTFIVTREGTKVSATIIDNNIKPNDETESLTDKVRHTAIAMSAISSFSKLQWQNLAKGIVSDID